MSEPRRGELWWGEAPDQKGRPFLVPSRDEAIPVLGAVLIAPVTRSVRGIRSEMQLSAADGMLMDCAASFDNVLTFPKAMLRRRMGIVGGDRMHELCEAMRAAIDC